VAEAESIGLSLLLTSNHQLIRRLSDHTRVDLVRPQRGVLPQAGGGLRRPEADR